MMTNSGYLQFAEALVFAQGAKAEAEAAANMPFCARNPAIWKPPKPGAMSNSP